MGKNNAYSLAAKLGANVFGNCFDRCIVALCACNYRFGYGYYVTITEFKSFGIRRFDYAVCNDLGEIITLTNDGATDTS